MALEEHDKRKRQVERARSHPLRIEILALYDQDEGRSLAAKDLVNDLGEDTDISTVSYHARVLQDAGLLPKDA
jgi:DNA-binding transcriptional ArsR family regulator